MNGTTLRLGAAFLGIVLALALLASALAAGSILLRQGQSIGDDLSGRVFAVVRIKGTCPICGGRY